MVTNYGLAYKHSLQAFKTTDLVESRKLSLKAEMSPVWSRSRLIVTSMLYFKSVDDKKHSMHRVLIKVDFHCLSGNKWDKSLRLRPLSSADYPCKQLDPNKIDRKLILWI